jgi:anaerobic ribonucleoside-triphosphate reductase activating protein|nr:MAG TPA: anaerobic ribonucleoside-triphosphate reductase activating protein [Bacteriophage sp.]
MRYATIRNMDISNGDGIRVALFLQGCSHHCKGCFNESTWDFNGGRELTKNIENELAVMCRKDWIDGLSILGGEPLDQNLDELSDLLFNVTLGLTNFPIWLWTGYTVEEMTEEQKMFVEIWVDVLIDGRFDESQRDLTLKYKGSRNQRVINIRKSNIFKNEIVLLED